MTKTILVTAASGHQGSAVVDSFAAQGYRVKAICRNLQKVPAVLKRANIEWIKSDLNEPATVGPLFKEVELVFCALPLTGKPEQEISWGKHIIDTAAQNGVRHLVYSSVAGADSQTAIPHFESKFQIEEYLRRSPLTYTIIRPSFFYENFLIAQVKKGIQNGKLISPIDGKVIQQYMQAGDMGKIVLHVVQNNASFSGKIVPVAKEEMDLFQVAQLFALVTAKPMRYQRLPKIIEAAVMPKHLRKMFEYLNKHHGRFIADLPSVNQTFPFLTPLSEWIQKKFLR